MHCYVVKCFSSVFKDFPVAYGCANGYVRLLRPASGLVKTLGSHAHGDKAAVTNVAVGGGINVVVVSAAIDGTIKVGGGANEMH